MSFPVFRLKGLGLGMLLIAGASLQNCGKNNSGSYESKSSQDQEREIGQDRRGASKTLSKNGLWWAEVEWGVPPRFDPTQVESLQGIIRFWRDDASRAKDIQDLKVTVFVPVLGSGTGNVFPRAQRESVEPGSLSLSNVFLSRSGWWRLVVLANVDQERDQWSTDFYVP